MRRLTLSIALAGVVLAGCATVPAPLQGQYGNISPRDTANAGQHGVPVRWGGRIVSTEPMADRTCFEIVSTSLDASGRPRWASDATGGRFIACRAGFYDPAIFQPEREVTVTGVVDGQETRRIGEYEYRLPRVQANVVYLWPVRERVDVVTHPMPSPWWWW